MLSLLLTPPTPLAFCLLPCCVCWDGARRDDVGRWVAAAERVAGTDWLEVVCDDGKRYYFHSQSQETSWHVPPEVAAKQALRLDPADDPIFREFAFELQLPLPATPPTRCVEVAVSRG